MSRNAFSWMRGLLASALMALSSWAVAQPAVYFFSAIPVGGQENITAEVFNSPGITVANLSVTIPMPPGFTVVTSATPTYSCSLSALTGINLSAAQVNVTFATLEIGDVCYVTFRVAASLPGLVSVPVSTSWDVGQTGTASGAFTAYLPSSAGVSFSPNPVAPGSPSTLSLTFSNPDPNHFLYIDDGEGFPITIPVGSWTSAVVTGTNPPGCATDGYYGPFLSLPLAKEAGGPARSKGLEKVAGGPPFLYEDGGFYLNFVAQVAPASSCTILIDVTSSVEGTFPAPPYSWDIWGYYSPIFDWYGFSAEFVLPPGSLVVRVPTGPIGTFSPARLDFGTIPARGSAGPVEVMLTNTGTGPLSILGIDVLGGANFGVSSNCLATLAPGANCSFLVTFSASTPGPYFGEVRVSSDAPGSPHTLALSGSVTAVPIGLLSAGPSLSFEERVIGTTSAPQAVTITNTGDATATISAIGTTGEFSVLGTCGSLAPGASCTVQVTFRPTGTGTRTGQLQVASNAANPVLSVGLTGVGAPIPAPSVSLSPATLDFGERVIGASTTLTATLTNSGNADLVLGAFTVAGDFQLTNGCPTTLAAKQSCRLDVEFIAAVPGRRTGSVRFTSNAAGSPHTVSLAGRGCRLAVTGRSFSLDCGR